MSLKYKIFQVQTSDQFSQLSTLVPGLKNYENDFLSQNKWAFAFLAVADQKAIGYSICHLAHSWRGMNMALDDIFIVDDSSINREDLGKSLYSATKEFSEKSRATQLRSFFKFPFKFDYESFGCKDLSVTEFWDLLHLPRSAIDQINSAKLRDLTGFKIQPATKNDIPKIFNMMKDLSVYLNWENDFWLTEKVVLDQFSNEGNVTLKSINSLEKPLKIWVVKSDGPDGEIVGYSIAVPSFSVHSETLYESDSESSSNEIIGRYMYLEDLYVKPEFRKKSIGINLIKNLCNFATQNNCKAIRWACVRSNVAGLKFYAQLGAENLVDSRKVIPFQENFECVLKGDREGWLEYVI